MTQIAARCLRRRRSRGLTSGIGRLAATLEVGKHSDNHKHLEWVIWRRLRMVRVPLNDLTAFVAVREHRSFTNAALQVGIAVKKRREREPTACLAGALSIRR